LLIASLFCAPRLSVLAQTPGASPADTPVRHSLSLEARSVASGGPAISNNSANGDIEATTFTRTYDAKNTVSLQVTVRNFAPDRPDSGVVEYFFFTRPASGGHERLFKTGTFAVQVGGGGFTTLNITSPPVQSQSRQTLEVSNDPNNSFTVANSKMSGEKISGWAVRLLVKGSACSPRGSSQHYADLISDQKMVAKMESGEPF